MKKTIPELTAELCALKSKEPNYRMKSERILNSIRELVRAEKNNVPANSEIAFMTEDQIMQVV